MRYRVSRRSARGPLARVLGAAMLLSVMSLAGAGCYGTYSDGYGSIGVAVAPSYTYGTYYGGHARAYPSYRGYYRSQPYHGSYYRGYPAGGYFRGYSYYPYRAYRY